MEADCSVPRESPLAGSTAMSDGLADGLAPSPPSRRPARCPEPAVRAGAAFGPPRVSCAAGRGGVARRCGEVMGKRQLEQAVPGAAADIPAFYAARIPEPCTPGTLLIMSADCKGIVM